MSIPYIKKSSDGRYGLTGPANGYYYLYRIFDPDPTDPEHVDFEVGTVVDFENFDYACEQADEEMRVLVAQAREEFGP